LNKKGELIAIGNSLANNSNPTDSKEDK